jgi:adenosine kinase
MSSPNGSVEERRVGTAFRAGQDPSPSLPTKRLFMKQTPRVLVIGSLAYDHIMDFQGVFTDHIIPEKLHTLSVSFGVSSVRRHFGGTAGNIAYTLAQLKVQPVILSQLGKADADYRKRCRELGIEDKFILAANDDTASAWIMTDRRDNQITAFHGGAMKKTASGNAAWKKQKYAWAIISPGNNIDRRAVAQWCRETKTPFIFDPGQRVSDISKKDFQETLKGAAILIVNDYELEMVKANLKINLAGLLKIVPTIVTTLGSKGSVIQLVSGEKWKVAAVKPKKLMDPTGAGDAYRGGLIAGLVNGLDLPKAAQWGAIVAARAIADVGTQEHKISLNELRRLAA